MNWAGCIGVGPTGLLMVPNAGGWRVTGVAEVVPSPAFSASDAPAPSPRTKRTRLESALLRDRIVHALRRAAACREANEKGGVEAFLIESHADIATREGVTVAYVEAVAAASGTTKPRRTRAEVQAIVRKARELMRVPHNLKQKDAAKACGVSQSYLCQLLDRYGWVSDAVPADANV